MYEILYAYILIIRKKPHIVMGQSTTDLLQPSNIHANPLLYKNGHILYMFRVRLILVKTKHAMRYPTIKIFYAFFSV